MKGLKLTILIEPGKKSELINVFGNDYTIVGGRVKFLQYSFPSIKMFTTLKLEPIVQLLSTYEKNHGQVRCYFFHLKDDDDNSFSPVYFSRVRGVWSLINSKTGVEEKTASSLFTLI